PTILVCVAAISVIILLIYVVPQFETTFAQAGKALPLATAVVVAIGAFFRVWWWAVALGLVLFVLFWRRHLRNPRVRRRWDERALAMPLVGDLVRKIEVARFARTLATLLGNGVTLLSGLAIVKETMGNDVLAEALDGVIVRLR